MDVKLQLYWYDKGQCKLYSLIFFFNSFLFFLSENKIKEGRYIFNPTHRGNIWSNAS